MSASISGALCKCPFIDCVPLPELVSWSESLCQWLYRAEYTLLLRGMQQAKSTLQIHLLSAKWSRHSGSIIKGSVRNTGECECTHVSIATGISFWFIHTSFQLVQPDPDFPHAAHGVKSCRYHHEWKLTTDFLLTQEKVGHLFGSVGALGEPRNQMQSHYKHKMFEWIKPITKTYSIKCNRWTTRLYIHIYIYRV